MLCKHVPDSEFVILAEAGIQGEGWHQPHPNTSNDQASFSYLGVPATAGMGDYYESMSRTPIRDSRLNRISMPILPPGVDTIIRRHRHFYVANVSRMPQLWGVGQGNVARGLVPRLVPATPANPIIPALGAIQERHGRRNRPGHLNPSQTSINSCRIIASRILCKTNVSAYQHLAGR